MLHTCTIVMIRCSCGKAFIDLGGMTKWPAMCRAVQMTVRGTDDMRFYHVTMYMDRQQYYV